MDEFEKTYIYYGEYIENTRVLGPGTRFALWVSGCCFHCEGCIGENYKHKQKWIEIHELAEIISRTEGISGITISGGEPFLQPKVLTYLLKEIKPMGLDVIVYTGFEYDDLLNGGGEVVSHIPEQERDYISQFLREIDILIDGKYRKEYDGGYALIGSGNQNVRNLSERYLNEELQRIYGQKKRTVELVVKTNKTLLVGVPDKTQAQIWKNIKREVLHEKI